MMAFTIFLWMPKSLRSAIGEGAVQEPLGQRHRDGGSDSGGDLFPKRGRARHALRMLHRSCARAPEAPRLLRGLGLSVRAARREPANSYQQHHHAARDQDRLRVLADLELHVHQLVPAAIELRQRLVEPHANDLDLPLDLRLRLAHASRSLAHRASSLRLRRVDSSGEVTRFFQPTVPAMVPTASTAAATIKAAAQSATTCASAKAAATRNIFSVQSAQTPAMPRPLAIETSALRSLRSSDLASSISFFASSVALSTTCPISSRLLIPSTGTVTASENAGSFCMVRGEGSAILSLAIDFFSW